MVERVGWTLIHSLWEGTGVAVLLAVMLWACRRASANLRYVLACAALAFIVALPAATFVLLAPRQATVGHVVASTGTSLVVDPIVVEAPAQSLLPLVVGVWAVGTVLMSARLLGSLVQIERWKRRHARPAEDEWQARVDALAGRLGIARRITVLVSDRIGVPAAWGVLKAFIVLPTSLVLALPPESVETILLHELAHFRRHDYLVNLLQTVVETALFYHPAVWWVSGVVRREREHGCDDVVVATLTDPMPYARALLHLEERRHDLPRPTLSAKGTPLMNRIARILGTPPAPALLSPVTSTLAALAVLGAVLGGAYEAQASPQRPTTQPPKVSPSATVSPKKAKAGDKRAISDPYAQKAALVRKRAALMRAEVLLRIAADRTQELHRAKAQLAVAQAQLAALRDQVAAAKRGGALRATPMKTGAAVPLSYDVAVATAARAMPAPTMKARATDDEIEHSVGQNSDNVHCWVDVKDGEFSAVMRRLAMAASLDVVIAPGLYTNVTLYVDNKMPVDLIQILCKASNATYRIEGGIYYFTPKPPEPTSLPGGFGNGGGGGFGVKD